MNGNARTQRLIFITIACLAVIGLADSVYLTVEHLSGRSVRCAVVSGCDEVLASSYAVLFGYPLALFGAAAYFIVFSFAVLLTFNYVSLLTPLRFLIASMFVMSLRLVLLQAFVLKAYCFYCLISAALCCLMTVLVVIEYVDSRRS